MNSAIESKTPPDAYFANLVGEKLSCAILERTERYERFVRDSGLWWVWLRAWRQFHGMDDKGYSSHRVHSAGDDGKLARMNINQFRNLVTHFTSIATATRSSSEPLAINDDQESAVQVEVARTFLEYEERILKLEQKGDDAVELAAVLGSAETIQWFNAQKGKPTGDANEQKRTEAMAAGEVAPEAADAAYPPIPTFEGEIDAITFGPHDTACDPRQKTTDTPWKAYRAYLNKYDLAASFPEHAKEIIGASIEQNDHRLSFDDQLFTDLKRYDETSDLIDVWFFFHDKTPACPNGKFAIILGSTKCAPLLEDDLPYRRIPRARVAPATIIGTPFGYSPAWDLLAPQEAYNLLQSIAMTNQRAHGVGIIAVPSGANLTPTQLGTALAMVEYTPGLPEPKPINFTQTPPEVFNNIDRLEKSMETIVGVNSVVRGNPEASLKSGSALMLVKASAVEFSTKFQASIVRYWEETYSITIEIGQDFFDQDRLLPIVGIQDATELSTFSGEKIKRIQRVKVDTGNPLFKTLAGRVELANSLLDKGHITIDQWFTILKTGRFESASDSSVVEEENMKRENELLLSGAGPIPSDPATGAPMPQQGQEYVSALITDNHRKHIVKHLDVVNSVAARKNPNLMENALAHIREHENQMIFLTLNRPALLELTGQPPLQSVQAMIAAGMPMPQVSGPGIGAPPPPPGAPGSGQAPPAKKPQTPQEIAMQDVHPAGPGQMPNMPKMPRNPETGERPPAPPSPHVQ